MRKIVTVLVLLFAAAAAFGQVKHIGFWVEFVDYDGEYENMIEALDSAEFDYVLHEYWHYDSITADSLNQVDVFITPELESGGYSYDTTAGSFLGPILRPWVEAGGLLLCFYQHGADFITAAGFDTITTPNTSTYHDSVDLVLPTHPIAEGVEPRIYGMSASYAYATYSGYTPVTSVDYSGDDYMHSGFQEFGAGCVCYLGWDYFETETPNQDRLFQNAVEYWGMRSEGPILREFYPPEDAVAAGDVPVKLFFQDEEGVELPSVQLRVNGDLYTGYDAAMTLSADTVILDLPDTLPDGAVNVQIQQIEDALGHEGPDTAAVYTFYVDNTPPVLDYYEPEGVLPYIPDGSLLQFHDELAGTNPDNWFFLVSGNDTVWNGDPGVIIEGDTAVLIAYTLAGIDVPPGDTNHVEFTIWDAPDVGYPNSTSYNWWFLAATAVPEDGRPEDMAISISPNPFNSACRISAPEGAEVDIFDFAGRFVASLPAGGGVWRPGESIGTGIYFARISGGADPGVQIRKLTYLK